MFKSTFAVLLVAAAGQLASANVWNQCIGNGGTSFNRDAAGQAIGAWCAINNGATVGSSTSIVDVNTNINLGVSAAGDLGGWPGAQCAGAAPGQISNDQCVQMLYSAIDNCDTDSGTTKYGNNLLDDSKCIVYSVSASPV